MAIVNKTFTFSSGATIVASEHNENFDTLYSLVNGNIQNVNIAGNAAIENSKLNLASITQDITHSGALTQSGLSTFSADTEHTAEVKMTGDQLLFSKGADVASGTSITLGDDGNQFDITGTTTIQTITIKQAGSIVWLKFDGALTLTDNTGNLELQGADITISAEDTVGLLSDGTNWHLVSSTSAATDLKIPSQAQGDVLYFNGTIWTRLGVGTTGEVLTTKGASANPVWAVPGLKLIDTYTFSNVSTSKQFTLESDKKYRVIFHLIYSSNSGGGGLSLHFNNNSAANYQWVRNKTTFSGVNSIDSSTSDSEISLTHGSMGTNQWIKSQIDIDTLDNGSITAEASIVGKATYFLSSYYNSVFSGVWTGGAVTAFHIQASTNRFNGTVYLYEYALS